MCPVFQGDTGEADGQPGPHLLTIPPSPAHMARDRLTFGAPVRRTVHERLAADRPAVARTRRTLLSVDVQTPFEVTRFAVHVDVERIEAGPADVQRLGASEHAITDPIGQERTEPIRRTRHFVVIVSAFVVLSLLAQKSIVALILANREVNRIDLGRGHCWIARERSQKTCLPSFSQRIVKATAMEAS